MTSTANDPHIRWIDTSPLRRFVWVRGFALLSALALFAIELASDVPLNLLIIKGDIAGAIAVAYAFLLVFAAIAPERFPLIHQVGAPLAVLVWGGRAGGFVELALERSSWSLTGAVSERLIIAMMAVLWHQAMAYRSAADREHARHLLATPF